jgi:hypothetical protein
MKRTFILIVVLLTLFSVQVGASARTSACAVGDIRFVCPKGFKPLSADSKQPLALFFRKQYGLGLFVASPEAGFDEQRFMTDLTKTTLAKMFPKESQTYSWKPINFSDWVSKFEVGGGMVLGFNGSLSVLIKYRHIRVKGKEVIVGYAAEFGRGAEAKESFERSSGGDSAPGCIASVEVIYSITGEKIDEKKPPCTLDIRVG